ncbi:MAG: hypothetical protein J7J71_03030 [Deltaproteobacteria bacterium]|nr:hypothetical protein [Candidatus Tharpella sp.]
MNNFSRQFMRSLMVAIILLVIGAGSAFADYAYYFPYFSSSTSKGEVIGLQLHNTTNEAADVKIAIMDPDGVTLKVESWQLASFGQRAAVIGADLTEAEGSFQVLSTKPLTGFAFLFANQMRVMYDMKMTQTALSKLDIPQVAQDAEWGMRILVANPGEDAVAVNVTYRAPEGSSPTAAYTFDLKAYGSAVVKLVDLMNGWNLPELSGGSLELVTDGAGVVAFATYDSLGSGGSFYAGIGAVDPTKQEDNFTSTRSQYAVVSCSAPGYGSGAHALIDVEKPRSVQENLLPAGSDIKMAAQGEFFYRIARSGSDSVTKFAATAPATPVWQYSTLGDEAASNPQSMIFASSTKAYIPRFNSDKMWVVNPETTTEAGFKTGAVDLSAYADADGLPEMTQGVVVNGKLFLVLQRLDQDNGWIPQTAYLVVIDTATNAEIDTKSPDSGDLKGIPLPVKNPWNIVYKDGKIYVNGVGSYASSWAGTPADYSGGIVSVDPSTYAVKMIIDDGDDDNHPYGNISMMTVVSATKGYFVAYAKTYDGDLEENDALYSFNPTTGVVSEAPIAAFPSGKVPSETSVSIPALGVDDSDKLWVASNTSSGGGSLTIINSDDDTVDQVQSLNLNPQGIAFGTWE